MESMELMDKETFDAHFGQERTWTTVTSDGTLVPLKPNGADIQVQYEDRIEYIKMVQQARLTESDAQVSLASVNLLV